MSMKSWQQNNGFTLIEILVTYLYKSYHSISGMVSVLKSSKTILFWRKENINQAQENL